jgi:hypothetical protein
MRSGERAARLRDYAGHVLALDTAPAKRPTDMAGFEGLIRKHAA